MKLLLVEPAATGHRMALYTRLIAREAVKRKWSLSLMTTEEAIRHPAFELVKAECDGNLDVITMPDYSTVDGFSPLRILSRQNAYHKAIADTYQRLTPAQQPDLVYVVNLDNFDKVLPLRGTPFGKTPYCGMMMSIKFHCRQVGTGPSRRSDGLFKFLFKRALRARELCGVMAVDESFLEYAKRYLPEELSKIHYVPDAGFLQLTDSGNDARSELDIPLKTFVILVYGSLSARKGIIQLANAVQAMERSDVAILLAGAQDSGIEHWLHSSLAQSLMQKNQLFLSNGFHDATREQGVFRAANAVWVGYVGGFTGSSGVMYQAGAAGLPVIAMRQGLIGWQAKRYRIGPTVDPAQILETRQAIDELMTDKELHQEYSQNATMLARAHSPEEFGAGICDVLETIV